MNATNKFVEYQPEIILRLNECMKNTVDPTDLGILLHKLSELCGELSGKPLKNKTYFDDISILQYCRQEYRKCYDNSIRSMQYLDWDLNNIKRLYNNQRLCLPHIQDDFLIYNNMSFLSFNANNNITITQTTCKRYDLFEKTVISFINCCLDLNLVHKWIVVDDNSSESDRKKMKEKFPWIEYVMKPIDKAGHSESMNILQNMVTTDYVFHMEDDWKFIKKDNYLTKCKFILDTCENYGQCLLNMNYAEDESGFDIKGGIIKQNRLFRYYEHEHYKSEQELNEFTKKNEGNPTCAYWPHFSLRIGLLKKKVWDVVGKFNLNANHFEMEYAYRYRDHNFKTVFLDNISCIHIGKKTFEKRENHPNAYDLNNIPQFGKVNESLEQISNKLSSIENKVETVSILDTPPRSSRLLTLNESEKQISEEDIGVRENNSRTYKVKTYVINLIDRPDRLKKFISQNHSEIHMLEYKVFNAINGKKLEFNDPAMLKLFETGDYNYREGMIGCALSHIKIWIELLLRNDIDCMLILEDDAVVCKNFNDKLNCCLKRIEHEWDIMWLGHFLYPKYKTSNDTKDELPIVTRWTSQECIEKSMGGTFSYIITKNGVKKLLDYINIHGVFNGIDWCMFKSSDILHNNYVYPHICYSECCDNTNKIDSDIQYNLSSKCSDFNTRMYKELSYWINAKNSNGCRYFSSNIPKFENISEIDSNDNTCKVVIYDYIPKRTILLTNITFLNLEINNITEEAINLIRKFPLYTYKILNKYLVVIPQTLFTDSDLNSVNIGDGYFSLHNIVNNLKTE